MKLSAPIFRLKRQARLQSRDAGIPLNEALDSVAKAEGFQSWGLLAASDTATGPAIKMLSRLHPGDFVLLGARPGHGKTLLGLQLIVGAIKAGRRGAFFTFEYNESDILKHFRSLGADPKGLGEALMVDTSETISADYIIDHLRAAPRGTVVVVDYLQLLDQKRENPELAIQVSALRAFARAAGVVIVLISQIDRSYDPSTKAFPDISDIRLPNPLDLALFTKTCFLNNGEVRFEAVA